MNQFETERSIILLHEHADSRETAQKLFAMWHARLLRSASAHYTFAERCEFRERILTTLNLVAAILVLFLATSPVLPALIDGIPGQVDASGINIKNDFAPDTQSARRIAIVPFIVPILSLAVVLFTALQYMLQNSQRAFAHKTAGNEFSNLRRKLERYWGKPDIHVEAIHNINRAHNAITKSAPIVPKKHWQISIEKTAKEIEFVSEHYFGHKIALEGVIKPHKSWFRPWRKTN